MSHNAAKITGTLESAGAHLSAMENDIIHARVLIEQDSKSQSAANNRLRDIESMVAVAKRALLIELSHWESEIEDK